MVKRLFRFIVYLCLLFGIDMTIKGQEPRTEDWVRIQFVDSRKQPIPYFTSHFQHLSSERDRSAFHHYLQVFPWDQLLPYQDVGAGIAPLRSDKSPYFIDEIDLNREQRGNRVTFQRFKKAGFPEAVEEFFVWYFPNGQVHMMSWDEANRLKRDQVNMIEISGDLGSGKWKELGDFLFDAAYFWRIDRGSKKKLITRCDALIEAKKKEGDLTWAGNLAFVREHWLHATARTGMFGRAQALQTPELDRELPWQGSARSFGTDGWGAYPLKPYLAFKKVLEVNPRDIRAIFWTQFLPLVNGFDPSSQSVVRTTDDFIRECRGLYGTKLDRLDDYHRFWFLKEFVNGCYSMTYVERYWVKKQNVAHDADLQWAIAELDKLFTKYPFLRYQIVYLKEWLLYMKDPNQVEPLRLIDGGIK